MKLFLHLMVSVKMDSYLKRKYLSMKDIFIGESHILDNVVMSLVSTQQTQTRVRSRTVGLEKNGWLGNTRRKKENIFSFLFSARYPLRVLKNQCHASNYPALIMCAVDYKSIIGGYRTLLEMNSVNPLLTLYIFESCLSHITTSIQNPHSILDTDIRDVSPASRVTGHPRPVTASRAFFIFFQS